MRTLPDLGKHASIVRDWLERRDANVVVVRPDRYVLGAARDLDSITTQVAAALSG